MGALQTFKNIYEMYMFLDFIWGELIKKAQP